jgi:N-methylhydantoinase B/oxoprolinase/acetone carboxylase alpha subunit
MAGGDFGDPFERDIKKVHADVLEEFVSIEGAKKIYGVVIDPGTLEVNIEATKALRKQQRLIS